MRKRNLIMKYKESFFSMFGERSEALFKDLLYEYKYLQSLRLVTRGITHNYNNIFAGAIGQIDPDSTPKLDCDRLNTLSDLINRGIHNTEVLFTFARCRSGERGTHSLQRILYQAKLALQAISPTVTLSVNNLDDFMKIEGDFNELVLMLFYLVENRIKDLQKNGCVFIDVSSMKRCKEHGMVCITIKDDSPCSNLTNQHDVFDLFASSVDGDTLSGLGLHISQQIARNHGGDIWIENNDNSSAFIVELPIIDLKKRSKPAHVQANTLAPKDHSNQYEKKVFFLVEDDSVVLSYIARGLQRKGHIVFSTESCAEAVEEFKLVNKIVEVVLVDIGLTDCDGFECMKQLATINQNVQIIFMSGDIHHHQEYISPDASFLVKPFTIRQLEELVYADTSRG